MEILLLVVGLMLAAVVLVGIGDRLRLPWPALMVVLGAVVAFVPGLPDSFELEPDLILPLFLPPLLFATAQRTSWAVFRVRWRTIGFLAVALVAATVAAVAGTAVALVPGLSVTAAIALGAMVAPPDPVAVEAVAGSVRMPRRLTVLQSEGLFNDATALVIFQAAVLATVLDTQLSVPGMLLRFVLGALGAVVLGLVVARIARWVTARVTDTTGRSALTLVLPFASTSSRRRFTPPAWWRSWSWRCRCVPPARPTRRGAAGPALVLGRRRDAGDGCGVRAHRARPAVRDRGRRDGPAGDAGARRGGGGGRVRRPAVWMAVAWLLLRRSADVSAAPRTRREAVVLTWCGMRGLATLALALSLPMTTDGGAGFPGRAEIVVIASTVLVATLLLPGFTLPALVRALGVAEDADAEHAAEQVVAQRARSAALARMAQEERVADLPEDVSTALHERMARLGGLLRGEPVTEGDRDRLETFRRARTEVQRIQNEALAAARAEVLAARREPGIDPEAADRVLTRLDLRTVLLD